LTCFKTPIYPQNALGDFPGQNHKGTTSAVDGTSISFADGHAVFWTYTDPRVANLAEESVSGQLNSTNVTNSNPNAPPQLVTATGLFAPNSPDLYQLEAWSGGPVPPGAVR
jgi:hypothetical protein